MMMTQTDPMDVANSHYFARKIAALVPTVQTPHLHIYTRDDKVFAFMYDLRAAILVEDEIHAGSRTRDISITCHAAWPYMPHGAAIDTVLLSEEGVCVFSQEIEVNLGALDRVGTPIFEKVLSPPSDQVVMRMGAWSTLIEGMDFTKKTCSTLGVRVAGGLAQLYIHRKKAWELHASIDLPGSHQPFSVVLDGAPLQHFKNKGIFSVEEKTVTLSIHDKKYALSSGDTTLIGMVLGPLLLPIASQ